MRNLTILTGHVTADVTTEEKYSRVSVAINESYKNKEGEWIDKVDYFNLTAFGKTAENLAVLKKGDVVTFHCKLSISNPEEGKYYTNIIVQSFDRLLAKKSAS